MNDGWIWGAVLFWQLKTEGLRLKTDRAYTHHQDMKELKEQKGAFGLEGNELCDTTPLKIAIKAEVNTGVIKLYTHIGGIKQHKSMVILREFPNNSALFGLVI